MIEPRARFTKSVKEGMKYHKKRRTKRRKTDNTSLPIDQLLELRQLANEMGIDNLLRAADLLKRLEDE